MSVHYLMVSVLFHNPNLLSCGLRYVHTTLFCVLTILSRALSTWSLGEITLGESHGLNLYLVVFTLFHGLILLICQYI